ncbi:MAG: N-acetyltransferase [Candidatus Thorarchaeota archaeon]|nr:N-acetyltransferase [Candidatus Thorarchaeota archaeon]
MSDAFVHPLAVVDDGAKLGKGTRIWHFAHVRSTAKIGDNCNIGKDVYVDTDVVIGNNVKIQNGVSVYHGVTIEDDVFCGPHMTFTNDLYPRAFGESWEVSKTLVKKGASIGAHATIICNTVLGKYSMVASGAVVTKDVPDHGLVMGNPARLVGFVCKCGKPLRGEPSVEGSSVAFHCRECSEKVVIPKADYALKDR